MITSTFAAGTNTVINTPYGGQAKQSQLEQVQKKLCIDKLKEKIVVAVGGPPCPHCVPSQVENTVRNLYPNNQASAPFADADIVTFYVSAAQLNQMMSNMASGFSQIPGSTANAFRNEALYGSKPHVFAIAPDDSHANDFLKVICNAFTITFNPPPPPPPLPPVVTPGPGKPPRKRDGSANPTPSPTPTATPTPTPAPVVTEPAQEVTPTPTPKKDDAKQSDTEEIESAGSTPAASPTPSPTPNPDEEGTICGEENGFPTCRRGKRSETKPGETFKPDPVLHDASSINNSVAEHLSVAINKLNENLLPDQQDILNSLMNKIEAKLVVMHEIDFPKLFSIGGLEDLFGEIQVGIFVNPIDAVALISGGNDNQVIDFYAEGAFDEPVVELPLASFKDLNGETGFASTDLEINPSKPISNKLLEYGFETKQVFKNRFDFTYFALSYLDLYLDELMEPKKLDNNAIDYSNSTFGEVKEPIVDFKVNTGNGSVEIYNYSNIGTKNILEPRSLADLR
ncbi:MAG: hypothetical protein KDD56_02950 [Bdellovibrionales bacterium]|nr:hypothetical protein [Bdellovibrionales bacterium]